MWLEIIAKHHNSKSFYLVGGSQNVIKKTVLQLKNEFPGINILNSRDGYIKSENETKALIQNIKELSPDFVIIGHPKALSEFSLKKLEQFFNDSKENVFLTYSSWVKYKIKTN